MTRARMAGQGMRLLRKAVLAYARKISPEKLLARSRQGALRAAEHAARLSPAYRTLVREAGLDPDALGPAASVWTRLPVLNKDNTFGRFSVAQLCRPVPVTVLADVLTSSGRGGPGFGFRLSTRQQHESSWFDIDLGLQDVFGIDETPTLLVNCLPMGVVFSSRAVTVANVSVREDMACAILRDVGPRFKQTLLCTDPLFVRRLLAQGQRDGVDWQALNTSVILGEEMLVEAQRAYIEARMGIAPAGSDPAPAAASRRLVGSSFGVGELGLNLLFETRETIQMRRALQPPELARAWWGLPAEDRSLPSVFCHNPLRCHVEVLNPDRRGWGELCFTLLNRQAVIPLPRFATGDLGRLVSNAQVTAVCRQHQIPAPWLPVVEVRGRLKDRRPGVPSVEQVKDWIYQDHRIADQLSGAFRIETPAESPAGSLARLTLQMSDETASASAAASVADSIMFRARSAGLPEMIVSCATHGDESWGPTLDHERKFQYLRSNSQFSSRKMNS